MRGGGLLRVVAATAAGAGLVVAAGGNPPTLDLARASDASAASVAAAPAARVALSCPGPDRPGVRGLPDADQSVTVITAAAPSELIGENRSGATGSGDQPPPGASSVEALSVPGAAALRGAATRPGATSPVALDGPRGLDLMAQGPVATGYSAVQVGLDRAPSVRGLGLVPCTTPAAESYLLAGSADEGRSERLVLTNPAPNPVTARVSVLGGAAPQDVVVPARSREVVVLGSIDDRATDPVVKVTADRGAVSAAMVETDFAGAVPRGSDVTAAAAAPDTDQLVPAAVVTRDGAASLRVGVPGAEDAVVRVSVLGSGAQTYDDVVQTVPGGSAATIRLPGLAPGRYAVRLRADTPVVAASHSVGVSDRSRPTDSMWLPAAAPVRGLAGVAVPQVPQGRAELVLSAPDGPRRVTVGTVDAAGRLTTRTVTVADGGATTLDVRTARAVWVRPSGGAVGAALVVSGRDGEQPLLAGVPLVEATGVTSVVDAAQAPRR